MKTLERISQLVGIKLIVVTLSLFSCEHQKIPTNPKKSTDPTSYGKDWSISSTNKWMKNEGLVNVESIIYDEANQVFYASSGIDYGLGTSGFISKISKSGILQELKWVKNLNRPTGMAIYDSQLYVADVNSLIVIDKRNGEVVEKYLEPVTNSGLNDVAVSEEGEVYVSASFIHSILKLDKGKLTLWAEEKEKLKWANGLIAENEQLLVAGLSLSTIDIRSKEISVIRLKSPIKDFDGIVSDGEEGYFLTTVENSGLYHLDEQKQVTNLKEDSIYFGDLDFSPEEKQLYVPRGNKRMGNFLFLISKWAKYLPISKTKNGFLYDFGLSIH